VKPRHEPVNRGFNVIDASKKTLDVTAVTYNELLAAPFDQRCPPEKKSFVGTGEAEIVVTAFAQAPEVVHH
jgi:hypothetical protein